MLVAYVVIIGGGLLITRGSICSPCRDVLGRRCRGLGLLAASGHCMTARWAFDPSAGPTIWRVIVTRPRC
jgi:hypothetical protein